MIIEVIIGVLLILDGIISIAFANVNNVTYNIFGLNSLTIVWIGHIFRVIRVLVGAGILFFYNKIEKYNIYLGVFLVLSGIVSILTAKDFDYVWDYFRFTRILAGIALVALGLR